MPVKSYVNQPDRIFINSSDDITTPYKGQFNTFQANYKTTIVAAERCQLLRATIPTPGPALPDYSLQFIYARKDNADDPVNDANIHVVRLLPYGYEPTSGTYAINRYISGYNDFVDLLNDASVNDNVTYNPYWGGAGDIVFDIDTLTNKINVVGADNTKWYQILGWDNPIYASIVNNITLPPGYGLEGVPKYPNYVPGYDLNLRVGFAMPDAIINAISMFATLGGVAIISDSYPNLVRTQCIYLYSNIAVASAMGSNDRHNLLCVIPVNSPALGVTNYTALTINFLTKVANDNLQNVNIEMLDDANQPYMLPDNAQVNLEIAFKYYD